MTLEKRRVFLLIFVTLLISGVILLIVLPKSAVERVGLLDIPVVQKAREQFNPEEQKYIELIMVGDIMLGRNVMITSLDKNDPIYPFRQVGDVLKSADLTIANLENPIVTNCPRINSGFTFCADPKMVEGLKFSGIDVVNLANNHTLNFSKKGLEETKEILDGAAILYTGVGNLAVKEVEGIKFGFLGFDRSQQGSPKLTDEEELLVRESDSKVDILIVSMHWGVEYQDKALPGVRVLAKRMVELGADVIHGHHPHWVQDVEYYDKISLTASSEVPEDWNNLVPAYYSLGNFVFDQMWSEETKKGLIIKLTLDFQGKIMKEERFPTYSESPGQPELVQ